MQALNEKNKKTTSKVIFTFSFVIIFCWRQPKHQTLAQKKRVAIAGGDNDINNQQQANRMHNRVSIVSMGAPAHSCSFSTSFFFFFSIFVSFNLMCIIKKKSISLDRLCEIMKWWALNVHENHTKLFDSERKCAMVLRIVANVAKNWYAWHYLCVCVCVHLCLPLSVFGVRRHAKEEEKKSSFSNVHQPSTRWQIANQIRNPTAKPFLISYLDKWCGSPGEGTDRTDGYVYNTCISPRQSGRSYHFLRMPFGFRDHFLFLFNF